MRIKACVDDTDLRTVTHHRKFLIATARKFKLKEYGDAVIYNGKSADRYRLVVHMGSGPMLVMPETEMDKRVSRYLRVSVQLFDLSSEKNSPVEVQQWLSDRVVHADARLEKTKVRARKAAALKRKRSQK